MSYTRFAIYYVPPAGDLADFGAKWLGWDVIAGAPTVRFDIAGLDDVSMTPRKYGFHGTLKPPFGLADGCDLAALKAEITKMTSTLAPATCGRLQPAGRVSGADPDRRYHRTGAACRSLCHRA